MKKRIPWLTLLLLLVVFTGIQCAKHALPPKAVSLPMIEGATTVGSAACADCHEDHVENLKLDLHAGLSCETCHGPGLAHSELEDAESISIESDRKF